MLTDAVWQVCEQLKAAMDLAMTGAMHRGGYCIVYPDSPEAKQAIGPSSQELFSQVSPLDRHSDMREIMTDTDLAGGSLRNAFRTIVCCFPVAETRGMQVRGQMRDAVQRVFGIQSPARLWVTR